MPRVKLFDRDEILEKAMQLFWEKGYASTSLNDLTMHLGIGKGSFYATFKSKQDLFHAAFDLYRNTRIEKLEQLLNSESKVEVGLRKFLELNLEEFLQDSLRKGCFVSNACSEMSSDSGALRDKLIDHHRILEQTLIDYMMRNQINPEKAESVASTVTTFLIGMSQQSKFNRERKRYLRSINHILKLLD